MKDDVLDDVNRRARLAFNNEMEMLTFYLTDGQLYGLNVFKIIEILECPKQVTVISGSKPAVKGTIDFRGQAITLIDLGQAMGLTPIAYRTTLSYVMVLEYSTSVQGFLVERPNMLINKKWDEIHSPKGHIYDRSYLTAVTYHEGKTIQILDVEKLLGDLIGIEDRISDTLLDQARQVVRKEHHILAVDDSKAARGLIASALTQMGLAHTVVEDGAAALELLNGYLERGEKPPFTLIFSDIEMPNMDGFTFTRRVKEIPALAHIHIAIHSSLSNRSNEEKARQMGADAFISKFQPDKMAAVVLDQIAKVDAAQKG
ncbi:MAG: chemotaxis protein CheV [Magnetococcales bacterium]|nr:chemotaxis protein CheV [Magnetococcales bacterium]